MAVNHELITETLKEVERFRLRSNDMIHFTSAQRIAMLDGNRTDIIMVSSDRELTAAANSAGLTAIDPQASDSLQRLAEIRDSNR